MSNLTWEQRQALARQQAQQYAAIVARQKAMQQAPAPLAPKPQPQPIGLLGQMGAVASGLGGDFMAWLKSLTPEQRRQYEEAQRLKVERALQEAGQ